MLTRLSHATSSSSLKVSSVKLDSRSLAEHYGDILHSAWTHRRRHFRFHKHRRLLCYIRNPFALLGNSQYINSLSTYHSQKFSDPIQFVAKKFYTAVV